MKSFTLKFSEQFGPKGPQAGDQGLTHESDRRVLGDVVWYFTFFDDFDGYFLLPEYMIEWDQ